MPTNKSYPSSFSSASQALSVSTSFVQEKSSLYEEFMAEREEILKHKWIQSEKIGYDIGFERALIDWIRNHRDTWRSKRKLNVPA